MTAAEAKATAWAALKVAKAEADSADADLRAGFAAGRGVKANRPAVARAEAAQRAFYAANETYRAAAIAARGAL